MELKLPIFFLYLITTLFVFMSYRIIVKAERWQYYIVASFCIFFFLYNGVGLSELSVEGGDFYFYYVVFLVFYLLAFHFFSYSKYRERSIGLRRIHLLFDDPKICNLVLLAYMLSSLMPLVAPEFRINLLFSPPSINFVEVFSEGSDSGDESVKKLTRYLSFLLLAPFLLSLGSQKKSPLKVILILAFLAYVEYVSGAYISRSSILLYSIIFLAYVFHQYPERRGLFTFILIIGLPLAGIASAWFLAFRLDSGWGQSIGDLVLFMLDIEFNFPRDAGVPLFMSGANGSLLDYLLWIFTIPIPKVFFGKFIDYNINLNIAYILTGREPGDIGFSVPLTGNLFASLYGLGYLFWLEPILAGALTGFAYKTAARFSSPILLFAYIMVSASYVYNRAGIGGFAPAIYNTFIWLLILWAPILYFASAFKASYSVKNKQDGLGNRGGADAN